MKPTITKEQLEEIRKRAEAATEGPWKFCGNKWGDLAVYSPRIRAGMNNGGEIAELEGALLTDADFIANARQDIPALLDHIAELEAFISKICPIGDLSVVDSLLAEKNHMAEELSKLQRKISLYESYAQENDYYAILNEMGDEDDNV